MSSSGEWKILTANLCARQWNTHLSRAYQSNLIFLLEVFIIHFRILRAQLCQMREKLMSTVKMLASRDPESTSRLILKILKGTKNTFHKKIEEIFSLISLIIRFDKTLSDLRAEKFSSLT
jgi:hypothetical protein